MTVEIRQLVIRAVVGGRAEGPVEGPSSGALASRSAPAAAAERPAVGVDERHTVVAECARAVLRELRRQGGR